MAIRAALIAKTNDLTILNRLLERPNHLFWPQRVVLLLLHLSIACGLDHGESTQKKKIKEEYLYSLPSPTQACFCQLQSIYTNKENGWFEKDWFRSLHLLGILFTCEKIAFRCAIFLRNKKRMVLMELKVVRLRTLASSVKLSNLTTVTGSQLTLPTPVGKKDAP